MAPSPKRKHGVTVNGIERGGFLCLVLIFVGPAIYILHFPSDPVHQPSSTPTLSGPVDLRAINFAWNGLDFSEDPPPIHLRIAVFCRKWPVSSSPGGMERHALSLYSVLAKRGHRIHVFTSPVGGNVSADMPSLKVHFHEGEVGRWIASKAWEDFLEENKSEPFDVIHSQSVSLPNNLAKGMPNVVATWHGIALESLYSFIYQDFALRQEKEPFSPALSKSAAAIVPTIIKEIRFFNNYGQHVAISDSCGEILRNVYQIPSKRVHVILNGVSEDNYHMKDPRTASRFRSKRHIPENAIVAGVAGRLVKDKGHPLLFQAFSRIVKKYPNIYLVIAGSGPWGDRYRELGKNVHVLGPQNATQLGEFYSGIDVFVNPTLRPQGLDLTFMEAMMSGNPVLAPRYPSITGTLLVEEYFGFLFEPNVDSLEGALVAMAKEGREGLAERGRAGWEYAKKMFGGRKMSLAYERLFLCIKDDKYCEFP
ncbi:hypothetical protein MLD38_037728 [Melastoma candidum]|uniref:Uncharacterized protein n=1 Tax=Melastoma candidum TaxID=119954 RepID=A0ACB9LP40_9MYRT|nr:hypothetical protein MLD38_037728 [Melastoma candidum]